MGLKIKHKIAIFLLRVFSATWRIKAEGNIPSKPAIIAFWHGKMLPVWKYFARTGAYALISISRDGEILSRLLQYWDYNLSRGSSSKKGKEALKIIIANATKGYTLITPDGPRGPKEQFKAGATVAAQRTGVGLYLCGVEINNKHIFGKSWDNFELPMPFARILLSFRGPIRVGNDLSHEEIDGLNSELAEELTDLNG
jgi:lysophospholipid acyltransferase (LPLAT)-like uncharacterized protein